MRTDVALVAGRIARTQVIVVEKGAGAAAFDAMTASFGAGASGYTGAMRLRVAFERGLPVGRFGALFHVLCLEDASAEDGLGLVVSGRVIATVPGWVPEGLSHPGVIAVPLLDGPTVATRLVWLSDDDSPIIRALVDLARAVDARVGSELRQPVTADPPRAARPRRLSLTQAAAQAYFIARGGPAYDPDRLDADSDAVPASHCRPLQSFSGGSVPGCEG